MRVITQGAFGGPDVLHEAGRPIPEPGPTEIRVHVRAAGVNPVDWKTRAGGGMAKVLGELPFVLGWDVAGMVDAVGLGVTRFEIGDWVFGMPWFPREAGAYAEFVVAPSRHFARSPRSIDDIQAGALPLAGLTAWQALVDTANLQPGQRVLVHAAAGGVGHLAVQIAKARGAYVIGTASAPKHDLLADLGADEAIDYRAGPFDEAVHDVDVALDLIGGDDAFRALSTVRRGGMVISVPSMLPPGLSEAAVEAGIRSTGILVEPDYAGLEHLAVLVDAGSLRVHIAETFPLTEAGRAHEVGELGHTAGKLVLTTA